MRTILNSLALLAPNCEHRQCPGRRRGHCRPEDRGLRRDLQRLGQPHFEGSDPLNNPLTLWTKGFWCALR
jgi:hypothetical protein